ncbi:MAG TPA: double-strand break repair helicase AddA [Sphingomicrobium sp.]|nr:double-strand break repair helicase AddA [Sphingomicrobium sp.]
MPQLRGEQGRAADPMAHAALSASAGTGKTQVLTGRVLRLLLSGARPETILCITFTKAAAAEMANRIGARLAGWVRMKEPDLKKDLFALGEPNDPATLQKARRLFAKVLEAPGGLRIQTIHSFAQTLLASFPAEAGIAPGLEPIEGRAEQELARSTLANLLAEAEASGPSQLIDDVQCLGLRLGEAGAVDYLMCCARAPEALDALGPPETIEPKLRALLGLPDETIEDYVANHCGDDEFDCDLLLTIADANRKWGLQTGLAHAETIEKWLALTPIERAAALPELRKVVLTEKDTLRVSAGQARVEPDYETHAGRLANLVGELLRIQNGGRLAADMAAGLRAGQRFAAAYAKAKRSAGRADFDDLIRWTRQLLAKPGMGEWVRYKLDQRTDHILVDEAQDTNESQWAIVKALAEEFFSGSSEADERWRTLFMVGDFKQAIFAFQGTDPNEFNAARRWARDKAQVRTGTNDLFDYADRRTLEFRDLSINASYRSAQAILDAVDSTIRQIGFREMGLPEFPPAHVAHHSARPGSIELWNPFAMEDSEGDGSGEEGWLDADARAYADRLAEQVAAWITDAPMLDSTRRPLTPGDILILVRSRGELASLIVARLFARRVPVAGIDRLFLSKPFAVRDLLAAVAFAVQPLDDLNLANLLVSPLIGWNQEQLFDLAQGRESVPLWRVLRERASERDDFSDARTVLDGLLAMADYTTPSVFLETILSGPIDGRRKLFSRLGFVARDPIDELMSAALQFEQGEIPSLDRFHTWFARGDVEIQRDPSERTNAVRVMTVHGAKGLEAPYVILADATADPANLGQRNRPIDLPVDGRKMPVVRPRKSELTEPFQSVVVNDQEKELQEHWRLLYVGMTRASERLVVAGVEPTRGVPENSWHKRVERALAALDATGVPDPRWGKVTRFAGTVPARPVHPKKLRAVIPPPPLPAWVHAPAPAEPRPSRPLAPSSLGEDVEGLPPPSDAMRAAAQRGTLIHELLERLPQVDPAMRHAAALRWLERSAAGLDGDQRRELADQVCALISDERFAELFGPGSIGEAPLAATLPDGRVIAGTVDRLLVEDDRVSVIDFKTGRSPKTVDEIPAYHRAQMEAYAAALAVIFPGRSIRAALLYTSTPQLFELAA